jgi:tyrosine-protein kinase Etk/Wzc
MQQNQRDSLLSVLQVAFRWRKTIRNVCILALVGSIGISLLLKNYYQATTSFYPGSAQLFSPELTFGSTGQVQDYFGGDRELDRIIQISNSPEMVDFMVTKFNLYDHYDIDSTAKFASYKVRQRFGRLYIAEKNKNAAVEISVEDTDPQMAADMANAAREHVNDIAARLVKESQADLLSAFQTNLQRKYGELKILSDSVQRIQREYGIYDVGIQGSQMTSALIGARMEVTKNRARLEILDGNPLVAKDTVELIKAELRAYERQLAELQQPSMADKGLTLNRINEVMPRINILSDMHYQARKQMTYDLERYNQILAAYKTQIQAIHVVQRADVPLIKSRPSRSIIVIASVVAAFLFSILGALLAEVYRDLRWRDITDERKPIFE